LKSCGLISRILVVATPDLRLMAFSDQGQTATTTARLTGKSRKVKGKKVFFLSIVFAMPMSESMLYPLHLAFRRSPTTEARNVKGHDLLSVNESSTKSLIPTSSRSGIVEKPVSESWE